MTNKFIAILFLILISTLLQAAPKPPPVPAKPDHLVMMVFDQMRPDYIDRFHLANFQKFRASGVNYVNAIVGQLPAVTVVSHASLDTGLPVGELPWHDDVMWDKSAVLGKVDLLYDSTSLTIEQLLKGLSSIKPERFFLSRMKKKFGDGKIIAIGEKFYAATTFGGPVADSIITLTKKSGRCNLNGKNIPEYISSAPRYTNLDCAQKFGTENSFYPLDGYRFIPGADSLGGDVWTAEVALDVMKHETKWSALLLTFGAIDKIGHMTGDDDLVLPRSYTPPIDLKKACEIADAQLGRVLAQLKADGLEGRTLVTITADHGGQSNANYYGNGEGDHFGKLENSDNSPSPFWMKRIEDTGLLRLSAYDTALRFWLKEATPENIKKVTELLKEVSAVTHIVKVNHETHKAETVFENFVGQPEKFINWAKLHDFMLAETAAVDGGPDVIAYLADRTGYGKLGDHGGGQETVQRIPFMIRQPGQKPAVVSTEVHLIDLPKKIEAIF